MFLITQTAGQTRYRQELFAAVRLWTICEVVMKNCSSHGTRVTIRKVFSTITRGFRDETLSQPPTALSATTSVRKLIRLPAACMASTRRNATLLGWFATGSQTNHQCSTAIASTGQKN